MHLAVLGCTELYWAVLGCTGLYWDVLDCTGWSQRLFVCVFSHFWHGDKQPNNQPNKQPGVILEQAWSWPVWEGCLLQKIGIIITIGIKGHNNPQVLLLKPILIFTVDVWPMHCEIERFESLSDFLTLDLWNATLVLQGNPFFAILPTCYSRVVKLSKHLTSDQVGDTFSGHPRLKKEGVLNRQKGLN